MEIESLILVLIKTLPVAVCRALVNFWYLACKESPLDNNSRFSRIFISTVSFAPNFQLFLQQIARHFVYSLRLFVQMLLHAMIAPRRKLIGFVFPSSSVGVNYSNWRNRRPAKRHDNRPTTLQTSKSRNIDNDSDFRLYCRPCARRWSSLLHGINDGLFPGLSPIGIPEGGVKRRNE
uniref:Uncharacterized protein n=1 Tax=Romanomermis culicivorax TaxID=13658 RepID=A0A915IFM0_ROMCU